MGQGLLPGKKRMLSLSWKPRRKALLQSGPLSLLQEVSRPAIISRENQQHPAKIYSGHWRAWPPSSHVGAALPPSACLITFYACLACAEPC